MRARVARSPPSAPQTKVTRVAGLELDGVLAQRADAQLRAREVLHDRDGAPGAAGRLAHALRRLGVLVGGAVAEVQPRDVHALLDHAHEDLGVARGRADRGHDLRAALHARHPSSTAATRSAPLRHPVRPVTRVSRAARRAPPARGGGRPSDGRQPELAEDVRDVLLDRALGDHQALGDRRVRAALGHQPEHVALARGQLVERAVVPAAAERAGRRPRGPARCRRRRRACTASTNSRGSATRSLSR